MHSAIPNRLNHEPPRARGARKATRRTENTATIARSIQSSSKCRRQRFVRVRLGFSLSPNSIAIFLWIGLWLVKSSHHEHIHSDRQATSTSIGSRRNSFAGNFSSASQLLDNYWVFLFHKPPREKCLYLNGRVTGVWVSVLNDENLVSQSLFSWEMCRTTDCRI